MVKADTGSTWLMDAAAWLEKNRKQVIIGAVAAVVIIGGGILFYNYQSQREARASKALSEVRQPQSPTGVPGPGTAEAYIKVANEHSGTKAAARALLEAAGVYFVQGRHAEAQQQFDKVIREYPASEWQAEAALGAAACLEALGKIPEATAKYDEVRKRFANAAVVDTAKLNLARMYEQQDKPAEAYKIYEELVKLTQMNPYSGLGNEAGVRMEELQEKHPELVKTNVPPPLTQTITPQLQPGATSQVRTITLTNFAQSAVTNTASSTTKPLSVVVQTNASQPTATPPANAPAPAPKTVEVKP